MLARQPQARLWNRNNSNFPKTQGPVARKKAQKATQILRAGNVLPTPRGSPRKWGPGKGDYEHEVLIWSRPRWRFGSFAAMGKGTRRPQAAKLPGYNKPIPKLAPSSAPFRGTCPYPLCRYATSPLDKGSRPPGGRLFKGSAPHPPRFRSAPSPGKGEGKKEAEAFSPQ